MKKILVITLFASLIYACKKNDTVTTNAVTPKPQDERLMGVWVQDSSKSDSSKHTIYSVAGEIEDTCFFSKELLIQKVCFYVPATQSVTTESVWYSENDSIYTALTGTKEHLGPPAEYHYKIKGNVLDLYLISSISDNIHYWYHKI